MSVGDADKLIENLTEELKKKFPQIKHVSVHLCSHFDDKRKITNPILFCLSF